jgi:hypothetical protein
MDMGARPSWLAEACPPWCTREHLENDHPEDRRHQSVGSVVSVELTATEIPADAARSVELAAYLDQPVGQPRCWLRLESTDPLWLRIAMTTDSAPEAIEALTDELARADS